MSKPSILNVVAARKLRKRMTKAEEKLWIYLDNKGMCGFKFRRQHPVSGFVLDFYCPDKKLAIELDGEIHNFQKEYDYERQTLLERNGISFIRFKNNDIMDDIDRVLKTIKDRLLPAARSIL